MPEELPSLSLVRTFEVAGRRLSFTAAARELHVTHGAVSRAVRTLEDWLGVRLFRRKGRGLVLTPRGEAYLAAIGPALEQIASATAVARLRGGTHTLEVVAPPTFTVRWLIPRLPRFRRREPAIAVRVRTADSTTLAGDFDIAVRRGPEPWRGFEARRFLIEDVTPVAAPSLLRAAPVRSPVDLAHHTVLHADAQPDAWSFWLRAFAPPKFKPGGDVEFEHFYLALQAAIDGLGIAMGPLPLVGEDLAAGRLVAPFPDRVLSVRSYFAVTRARSGPVRSSRAIAAFVAWLVEEGKP